MSNLDYESENKYFGQSLRAYMGATERQSYEEANTYVNMFEGIERQAILNNIRATNFARGFTRLNYTNLTSGVLPRILNIITQKMIGKVYYQAKNDEKNMLNVLPTTYLNKALKKSTKIALATGRCIMAAYRKNEEKAFLECYSMYRHKYVKNSMDEITDILLFVRKHEGASVGEDYYIVEHRFYDRDNKPKVEYKVVEHTYSKENAETGTRVVLEDNYIPQSIKEEYKGIKFNVVKDLVGFEDLGVYSIVASEINLKFPDFDVPETIFNNVLDEVVSLENGLTNREVEKVQGRGQVLIPEFQKQAMGVVPGAVNTNVNNAFIWNIGQQTKNPMITKYPTRSSEDNKPTNVQFDIRAEQWENSINGDVGRICALCGISILDYDPRLLMTGQRTDDEINSMTDITYSTIQYLREINEEEINKMLTCIAKLYGIETPVAIKWSMASILNPTKNASLVIQKFNNGLITRKRAYQELNPDLSDDELNEQVAELEKETKIEPNNVDSTFENF